MSKIKVALLSLLAVVALSAVAASSASAGLTHVFFVEKAEVKGTSTFEVQGVSQEGWLEGVAGGNSVAITCQGDYTSIAAGTNLIEKEGKSKAKVEFRNCFVYKLEGKAKIATECKISPETIVGEATDELIGVGEDRLTGSKAEETFSEFELPKEEKCVLSKLAAIKFKVKGSELCTIPLSGEENVVHELFCTPGGSSLKTGAEPARLFTTELLKLTSAKPWSGT